MNRFIKKISFEQDLIPYTKGDTFVLNPGLNLLVGDQGAGKSTMLEVIRRANHDYKEHVTLDMEKMFDEFINLDCEQHNPRVMNGQMITKEYIINLLRSVRDDTLHSIIDYFKSRHSSDNGNKELYGAINDKLVEKIGTQFNELIQGDEDLIMNRVNMGKTVKQFSETDIAMSAMKSHGQTILPLLESFRGRENSLVLIDEPETALSPRSQNKLVKMMHELVGGGCQVIIATHCTKLISSTAMVLSLEHRKWMSSGEFLETQEVT